QGTGVIVTGSFGYARRGLHRRGEAGTEEPALAQNERIAGIEGADRLTHHVVNPKERTLQTGWARPAEIRFANGVPELAQTLYLALGGIARNNRRVQGANRNAGQTVGLDSGFQQSLVHTGLIGSQGAASLQYQGDSLVRGEIGWAGKIGGTWGWGLGGRVQG